MSLVEQTPAEHTLINEIDYGTPRSKAAKSVTLSIDGKQVASVDALREAIAAHKPGDKVSITVVHADGSKATVETTLARAPVTSTP